MHDLVDLILLKDRSLERETVRKILSMTGETIKENLLEGKSVVWVDLCKFTWKQKAKTKKAAQEWTEFPYMAEGTKVRVIPDNIELEGLKASEGVTKMKRDLPQEEQK